MNAEIFVSQFNKRRFKTAFLGRQGLPSGGRSSPAVRTLKDFTARVRTLTRGAVCLVQLMFFMSVRNDKSSMRAGIMTMNFILILATRLVHFRFHNSSIYH